MKTKLQIINCPDYNSEEIYSIQGFCLNAIRFLNIVVSSFKDQY